MFGKSKRNAHFIAAIGFVIGVGGLTMPDGKAAACDCSNIGQFYALHGSNDMEIWCNKFNTVMKGKSPAARCHYDAAAESRNQRLWTKDLPTDVEFYKRIS